MNSANEFLKKFKPIFAVFGTVTTAIALFIWQEHDSRRIEIKCMELEQIDKLKRLEVEIAQKKLIDEEKTRELTTKIHEDNMKLQYLQLAIEKEKLEMAISKQS
uniref:Uncharacterized protein n=1 Tax=Gloeochaete wittrockiana TaxID=38269 RepID=A0A096Y6R9_9EUKA|nr:hypothetical protein [Gloeochaete wittrockiana]AIM52012.1 hypothetical protein [Gloeochaete wittrockiana]